MGLTAIIGDALTDHSAHPFGLFIDGLDVIKEHATPSRFAVPIDSIVVTEAGPGAVSSMSFVIEDYQNVLTIADGARIEYWDLTNNWPIFAGFLEAPRIVSDFGEQAKRIEVQAYGLEALLDTVIVPSLVLRASDTDDTSTRFNAADYIIQIAGYGPLRNFGSRNGVDALAFSSQSRPIENRLLGNYQFVTLAAVDVSGLSLRTAIEAMFAASTYLETGKTATPFVSVDFYGGVRAFLWAGNYSGGPLEEPSDYADITLSDTPGGTTAAVNLSYQKDVSPNALVNAVYVKGAAAASTGWVVGDTTTGRREAYVTTTGTAEADKQAAAFAILSNRGTIAGRGEFDLLDFTPVNAHPGSRITITDAAQSWASKVLVITEIRKTFKSNSKQDWHVSFVDPALGAAAGPPSMARLTRTLTRGIN